MKKSFLNTVKIKLGRKLPWRVQTLMKFRPSGVVELDEVSEVDIKKKHYPVELNELVPPHHVEPNLHEHFAVINIEKVRKHCSDFSCTRLKKAKVYDYHNLVTVIKDNKIIKPLSYDPKKRDVHPSLTIFCYPEENYLEGKTLLLSTVGAQNNYFHFTIDLMQKLCFALDCGYSISDFDHILINKLTYNFQKEILKLHNIPIEKVVETEPGTLFNCEELVIPSQSPHNYFGYSILREKFLKLANPDKVDFPKKIYISRKNATGRRVVNEEEILGYLKPLGFEVILLENLSVLDQVTLFKNVEIVITPHGAGTTNIIYASPGSSLIEIHDVGVSLNTDFYPYISFSKVNYGYLRAETIHRESGPLSDHFNFQDIRVDLSQLKELIHKMGLNL